MPLLSPSQIHAVLKAEAPAPAVEAKGLQKLLEDANLSPAEVLDNLASLMRSGETDGVRVRAAETALKLSGLLNSDNNRPDFSVTINIIDSEFATINPILTPR